MGGLAYYKFNDISVILQSYLFIGLNCNGLILLAVFKVLSIGVNPKYIEHAWYLLEVFG